MKKEEIKTFEQSDIEDIRIIIKAKGKHWGLIANKENEKKHGITLKNLKMSLIPGFLQLADVVTPALEDIDKKKLESELSGQEDKINDEDKIMKDVISLLIDRRKMAAIKVYWDLHGCGLKEAKIAVDKIEDELKNEGKIKPYKQRLTDK